MAYRRKQGNTKSYTFKEDVSDHDGSSSSNSSSLAAQAIRASSAHRDSSLSSAYGNSAFDSSFKDRPKASSTYDYTSMKSTNEPGGLWGVLARKAKAIIDEDKVSERSESSDRAIPVKSQKLDTSPADQLSQSYLSAARGSSRKMDSPRLRKSFNAITSSLNHISDTIGTAFEEGRSIMEHKTADIIQETRKLQIGKKGFDVEEHNVSKEEQETLLKASRDVAVATAAKAKLLLREVKTLKADLAFARKRSSQLEEENRGLREKDGSGNPTDDDDLIRLQLETLLAEKARLAHENSLYARENRFLREIVEYHQLTMQDVVYLDENIEEVTEVNPLSRTLSTSPPSPNSPPHIQLQQETLDT